MEGGGVVVGLAFLVLAMLIVLYVPAFLTRRAMRQVVSRFYAAGALSPQRAKTLAELGLTPPNILERLTKPRDYKPAALRLLQQTGAVQLTQEGKLFLLEERLHESLRASPFRKKGNGDKDLGRKGAS